MISGLYISYKKRTKIRFFCDILKAVEKKDCKRQLFLCFLLYIYNMERGLSVMWDNPLGHSPVGISRKSRLKIRFGLLIMRILSQKTRLFHLR